MIIQNGFIEFKTQTGGEIDPETGFRSPVTASWGDPIPCQYVPKKFNQLAVALAGGTRYTEASYEVYVEEDAPTSTEQVRLTDRSGNVVGEFSVIQVEPLEAVCEKRILV